MTGLAEKHCVPWEGGVPSLRGAELVPFSRQLPNWKIIGEHHLAKTVLFPHFPRALKIYTHAIRGLSENDFVPAAKIDREYFAGLR
jgi:4a-hydroxytetrahydrobiopterin dehydratase